MASKAQKYTKTQARKACLAIQSKLTKMVMSGWISPAQFVKLTEPYDRLRNKLK